MAQLNINEIMEILTHRHPFLLIDAVDEMEVGVKAVARKNVTFNEPFFTGHFPGKITYQTTKQVLNKFKMMKFLF